MSLFFSRLNTCLKETDHNYNKLQDRVKLLEVCIFVLGKNCSTINSINHYFIYVNALILLQVDAQSSAKHNEKLHAEIEELLKVKRTLEEKKREDKELQASMSEHRGEDNETKVRLLFEIFKSSFIGQTHSLEGAYTYTLPYCVS